MKDNITWRDEIKRVGVGRVAKAMNRKYPTILLYVRPGSTSVPRKLASDLCNTMKMFLSTREYKGFVNSLASEILNVSE